MFLPHPPSLYCVYLHVVLHDRSLCVRMKHTYTYHTRWSVVCLRPADTNIILCIIKLIKVNQLTKLTNVARWVATRKIKYGALCVASQAPPSDANGLVFEYGRSRCCFIVYVQQCSFQTLQYKLYPQCSQHFHNTHNIAHSFRNFAHFSPATNATLSTHKCK